MAEESAGDRSSAEPNARARSGYRAVDEVERHAQLERTMRAAERTAAAVEAIRPWVTLFGVLTVIALVLSFLAFLILVVVSNSELPGR